MSELRTERLLLREWRDDDLPGLKELLQDPEVTRYLWGHPASDDEVLAAYSRRTTSFERHGFGLWAVERLDEPGRLIGWTGLQVVDKFPDLVGDVEVGWSYRHDAWGNGYATEAGGASVDYGFQVLGLKRIVALHHPDNRRSEHVMEKLGMEPAAETVDPQGQRTLVRAITREQWVARRGEKQVLR